MSEEARLTAFIEGCVGGVVVSLERQPRWRKAWYCQVELRGERIPLYIRGDKQLDAEPYPGLGREAGILKILEASGLPVPHVYGVCEDPEAIVMDRVPGERDVSFAASDEQRKAIALQYIEVMAKMHSLDISDFQAMGIELPASSEAIALAYVDANQPLYERTRRGPEPMLEFGLKWLRRNAPKDRNEARFIHGDAGQFLFDNGNLTCIHDFEASHIGDPLADLASLRVRNPTEPLGADLNELLRYYQTLTDRKIDPWALSYHTAGFMMTAVMALAGPMKDPDTPLQAEYLIWDITCRRAMLWAMAECLGVTIQRCQPPLPQASAQDLILRVLEQGMYRLEAGSAGDQREKQSALMLVDWLKNSASYGAELAQRDRAMLEQLLGATPLQGPEGEAQLEAFVHSARPQQDIALLNYFAAQIEARVLIANSLGERLEGYALQRIVL